MSPAPTMNDVAREAGVALKTVSRYVNGETNIDPVLVGRIGAAIVKLGYRRNLAAASIRPGWTSKTLALIIVDVGNPYYSTLTRAVETTARDNGYLLISASSDEDGARHDRLVDRLMEQRVDGLLIVPPRRSARSWADVAPPVPPIVFLDRPAPSEGPAQIPFDTVLADNAGGAKAATANLVGGGARRVAFLGDSLDIYTMRERHRGYVSALVEAGMAVDERLVRTGVHGVDQAAEAVARLLAESDADALFAANNRAAIGALMAFRSARRRLPLIGFDDFEGAVLSEPPVSVVSQDIAEMGRSAAALLIARLAGTPERHGTRTLPTKLVLRGSERR
jgi:LacI family transcriptional regulator